MAASGNTGGSGIRAVLLWLRSVVWRTALTLWRLPVRYLAWVLLPLFMLLIVLGTFVLFDLETMPRRAVCTSNLKQIGSAMLMYIQDYDERLPSFLEGSVDPRSQLHPYLLNVGLWYCPTEKDRHSIPTRQVYYGYNYLALAPGDIGIGLQDVQRSRDLLVLTDSRSAGVIPHALVDRYAGTAPDYRHHGANCLWLDGHVKRHRPEQLEKRFSITETLHDFPYWWPDAEAAPFGGSTREEVGADRSEE